MTQEQPKMSSNKKVNKKKLKSFDDSGTNNNLDNTAQIKNILDDLYIKNPKAHRFYCQIMGKRPSSVCATHCCLVGHNVAAFPSDWDGELPVDYNDTLTYKGNLPRMLFPPRHIKENDPLTELLTVKSNWTATYRKMVGAVRFTKNLVEYKRLTDEVARCSQHFVNMAAHVQIEPEPRFKSHFNWFYAGRGTLLSLTMHGRHLLLHSQLTSLHISPIGEQEITPIIDESLTFECGENNFILETICSAQNSLIALRTMNKVFLLKIKQGLTCEVLKTMQSKVTYTSVEFDPHHETILYVTDMDDTVDIVNLNTLQSKRIVLNQKPKYIDNWNTVIGFDRLYYVHATTKDLHIYEKRTHEKVYSVSNIRKLCEDCNDITAIRKSEHLPHCLYVGTNHHLFCVNLRSNKRMKAKFLSRWTHGMRCPPTYISVNDFGIGKEAVFLSSQWPEDTTVIVNDTAHLKADLPPSSMFLAFKLPNIFNSLDKARSKKLCLDPTLPIDKRISTAVSGLYVRENDDKFEIFIQNSLGDITVQYLYPQHLDGVVAMEFSNELHEWCNTLKTAPEKLTATEISNISALWAFKECSHRKEPRFNKKGKNKVNFTDDSIVELFESEDFDDDLLAVWNLEEPK